MIGGALLLKGFVAAVVVGFVTASIRSWIDRVFLVIMLAGLAGLPIAEAIGVNLVVLVLAALLQVFRQRKSFAAAVPPFSGEWLLVALPAAAGAVGGRLVAAALPPAVLLGTLGVYAILVGVRILLVKPAPEREGKAHPAWLAPVALTGGLFTGLLSAGGKPFAVPIYNAAMGHHPQRAYALASVGVAAAAIAALAAQFAVAAPSGADLLLAGYEFVLVTAVALLTSRFWSEKLAKIVNLIIAPLLVVVGLRFFAVAFF